MFYLLFMYIMERKDLYFLIICFIMADKAVHPL